MVAALWLLPSLTGARPEGDEACDKPRLLIDAAVLHAWPSGVLEVQRQLDHEPDVDGCATVFLSDALPNVTVRVVLPDGRTTVRHVTSEDALAPAVKALVTRLPELEPVRATAQPAPLAPPESEESNASPAPAQRVHLETGIAPIVRVAGKPLVVGYGLSAHLYAALNGWLVGAWLRWDFDDIAVAQGGIPADHEMSSFLLGVAVGRRLELGRCLLDLMVGPNLMIENQEAFEGTSKDTGGVFMDASVGSNIRLLLPRQRSTRFMVLLAADVYPTRAGRTVHRFEPLPALPAYTATAGLGMSWSAL